LQSGLRGTRNGGNPGFAGPHTPKIQLLTHFFVPPQKKE